ncbi:uncharacterized protein BJ171DRAFT_567868 [Polychytrium aggregatum]|uniref:uncharacterized protein n=1 Tax=Polychytrium aggregatum TaxID=110093 RepID=UPI0022FEA1E1|nr:uncharacterized protein BJ171DRAFT_567868 [Polychytrium aggregatum]KAI9204837.1 hypothetical protein BJ171DRAFT_567868 [Polychytrium aggregatum]
MSSWFVIYSSKLNSTLPQCLSSAIAPSTLVAQLGDLIQPLQRCGSIDGDTTYHSYSLDPSQTTVTDRACSDPGCSKSCQTSSFTLSPTASRCSSDQLTLAPAGFSFQSSGSMDPSFNTDSFMYQPNYLDATCTTVSSVCRSPVYTACTMINSGFYAYSILLQNGNSKFIQPFGCLDANCNQCQLDASILPNALAKSPTDCFSDTGSTSYQLYFLANKTAIPTVFPNGSAPFASNQVVTRKPSATVAPMDPSASPPAGPVSTSSSSSNTVIIGAVVGAVALCLCVVGFLTYRRYKNKPVATPADLDRSLAPGEQPSSTSNTNPSSATTTTYVPVQRTPNSFVPPMSPSAPLYKPVSAVSPELMPAPFVDPRSMPMPMPMATPYTAFPDNTSYYVHPGMQTTATLPSYVPSGSPNAASFTPPTGEIGVYSAIPPYVPTTAVPSHSAEMRSAFTNSSSNTHSSGKDSSYRNSIMSSRAGQIIGVSMSQASGPVAHYVAIQDHNGDRDQAELSFLAGQTIAVSQVFPNGWAMSQNNATLAIGFAPMDKLRVIEPAPSSFERTQPPASYPPKYSV